MKTENQIEQEINDLRRSGALVWEDYKSKNTSCPHESHFVLELNGVLLFRVGNYKDQPVEIYGENSQSGYFGSRPNIKKAKQAAERMIVDDN